MKLSLLAILVFGIGLFSACVSNTSYHLRNPILRNPVPKPIPDCASMTEPPPIAFVEFDDMGELWDRCKGSQAATCEYQAALDLIDQSKRAGKNVVVVTFIHGWKNNASYDNEKLRNFQCVLQKLQRRDRNNTYIGVYIAWRGKLSSEPVTSNLSFWNRRHAAMRVAAVSLTEVILGLAYKTKEMISSYPDATNLFVVIGHSFGGLILERAMAQGLTALLSNTELAVPCRKDPSSKSCFQSPADLIVLLNPALESIETQQLIDMLERKHVEIEGGGSLIVSITGKNDWATGNLLPLGHSIEALGKSFREREPDNPYCNIKPPTQKELYTHTAGHLPYFFTHDVLDKECDQVSFLSFDAPKGKYYICPRSGRCNNTPYYVMSVGKDIIDGHEGIWTEALQHLIIDLINRMAVTRQTTILKAPHSAQ